MIRTTLPRRQADASTAPPAYIGYTLQGGACNNQPTEALPQPTKKLIHHRIDALKECNNGGSWTTTGTLGYCDNQLCTSCSGEWKFCTDDFASAWFALLGLDDEMPLFSLLTGRLVATNAARTQCCKRLVIARPLRSLGAVRTSTHSTALLEVSYEFSFVPSNAIFPCSLTLYHVHRQRRSPANPDNAFAAFLYSGHT